MGKLQFGHSTCEIAGTYVPVAEFNLAPKDGVYFAHHVLLWKEPATPITLMSLKGAFQRVLAGMPIFMTEARGPGRIAFSRDAPGELLALPMKAGEYVDVREHLFVVATHSVTYDWFNTDVWFTTGSGKEAETHYPLGMFMDRFGTPIHPGLLLIHAAGNVFVRTLQTGQTLLVKPTALVFKDPSVSMHLHFERPMDSGTTPSDLGLLSVLVSSLFRQQYAWLKLRGPGRVAISSVFERIEGEGRTATRAAYSTTEKQW